MRHYTEDDFPASITIVLSWSGGSDRETKYYESESDLMDDFNQYRAGGRYYHEGQHAFWYFAD